jgi:hypothetical protein
MSEPTRYEYSNGNNYWGHFINPKTQHFAPYGEYVRYEDYARLKAEVERLTKAGDKAFSLWSSGDDTDANNFKEAIWVWTVAKKGGQP